jgi:hypothetical protein
MMFAAMTMWAAFRAARLPLFAAHLLGLFTHPIFLFFSLASAGAGAAYRTRRRLLAVTPLAAVGIYAAAWGVWLARTVALPTTSWMPEPAWAGVVSGLMFWGDHATPILVVTVVVLLAVRGAGAIRPHAVPIAFLLALAALVITGTIGVSMVHPVYLASRTPVLVLPAVAVVGGVLVAEPAPLLVTWAAAGLVVVSALRFTVRSAERPDPYPTRASLAAVAPRMRCGDTIVAAGLAYAPIVYYASKAGVPSCVTVRAFPGEVSGHPGWVDLPASGRSALESEAELTASSAEGPGTLWTFVQARGVGAEAGAALVDALSRVRSTPESIAASGSFFDRVVVFAPSRSAPARP